MPNEDDPGAPAPPDDIARTTLLGLLEKYGLSLAEDPRRCEGLLRDLCATCRREIHVLVTAIDERVPAELLDADDQLPLELTIGRLVKRLVDNRGLTRNVAVWAVESWAMATGLITADDLTPPSPEFEDVAGDLLPDTVPANTEETTSIPAPSGEEIVAQRRAEGLIIKGERLIKSLPSRSDCFKQLECAEGALLAFTEAMELISDDDELRKGLEEALLQTAIVSTACGNEALRQRNYSVASSHFLRTLEIDPGNAEAESRLNTIRDNRDEFIAKARQVLEKGEYQSSTDVLQQVLRVFPDDPEIKALLSDSQSAGDTVEHFMQETLPELDSQKRFFGLLEQIQEIKQKGLHIPELDLYERALESRINEVAATLQHAETSLAAGNHSAARIGADKVLSMVADHEGALHIKRIIQNQLESTHGTSKAIQAAHHHRRWFEAQRLLLLHPESTDNSKDWKQRIAEIDDGVIRSRNYFQLLPMVLLGVSIWLVAGIFARMFSGGIMDTVLEQGFGDNFGNSISESVTGQVAQLFLAFVLLPFFAAIVIGRRAMRSLGYLFIIVIVHALLAGAMIWLSKKRVQSDTIRFAFIYGAASGVFLSEFMRRLLQKSDMKGYAVAVLVGIIVAILTPLISKLPIRYAPGVLTSTVVLTIAFCSLLPVLGLVRRWSHFSYVPIAVILAYGLAMGSGTKWTPYLPWINGLLLSGAVILMIASQSSFVKLFAVLMMAPLTTVLFKISPDIETLPETSALIPVWLAVWGSLAIIHRDDIEPNRGMSHCFRLWKTERARGMSSSTPKISPVDRTTLH